jgi:hypothetical protein
VQITVNDNKGSAFVKGGLGCLGAFIVLGALALMMGGRFHIDAGGACMLFVIGGVIGLIVLSIYRKGYSEGRSTSLGDDRGPVNAPFPPRPDRAASGPTTCPGCGAAVNLRTGEGVHSPSGDDREWVCDRCGASVGGGE